MSVEFSILRRPRSISGDSVGERDRSPVANSPLAVARKLDINTPVCYSAIVVKSVLTAERDSDQLASIARRVCWWQSAEATLENTQRFLCQVMVFGTWDDACFALGHYGEAAFREALRSAPPGLFDNRSWHYWHHRLHLLPVPPRPQRAIPV